MKYIYRCEKCGMSHFDTERCAKQFTVYEDDYLGEACKVFPGWTFDGVAEDYGRYRNDEGQLLDDNTIEIRIKDSEGVEKRFSVGAEIDIHYTTTEL